MTEVPSSGDRVVIPTGGFQSGGPSFPEVMTGSRGVAMGVGRDSLAMANFPRQVFAGAGDGAVATPAAPPGDWSVSSKLPEVAANRPTLDTLKPGEAPQVTVSKYDPNAATQPDVLVKQDGSVEYAKGFNGNLANINIAFENGADVKKVQTVADAAADLQQQSKDGVLPKLVDNSGGLLTPEFKRDFAEQYSKEQKEPDGGGGGRRPGPGPNPGPDNGEDNGGQDGQDGNDGAVPPGPDKKFDGRKQANDMIAAESKSAGFLDGNVYGDKLMSAMPGGLQGMIDEIGHPPPFTPDELAKYMEKHKKEIQDNLKKMGEEATAAGDKDGAAAISKLSEAIDKPEFAQGLSKVINGSKLKTEKKDGKDVLTPDSKLDWSKESVQSLFSPEVVSAFNRSAMRQAAAKDPELTKLLETEAPAKEAESKAHAQKIHDALQALITKLKSKEAAEVLK